MIIEKKEKGSNALKTELGMPFDLNAFEFYVRLQLGYNLTSQQIELNRSTNNGILFTETWLTDNQTVLQVKV